MNAAELIGSTPKPRTRAVTLALRHSVEWLGLSGMPWTAACSGGPDSLALTFALADLAPRVGAHLNAVIVDHAMRPTSAAEAEHTRALLESFEIDARVVRVSVGSSGGTEAAAREARYEALTQNSAEGAVVFLGHTMDDQAETVLLGLGRGSGTRSLSGMREAVAGKRLWVRPLLGVRRFDTEGMCAELALSPVEDPSNRLEGDWITAEGSPLPRVALRHRVIPALSEALERDVVPLLARSADLLDQDASALEAIATEARHEGEPLIVEELQTLPEAVRTRVLINASYEAGADALSAAHVAQLAKLVDGYTGGGPIHLPGKVIAWREKEDVAWRTRRFRRVIKMMKNA